jgi:Zn-dependent protease
MEKLRSINLGRFGQDKGFWVFVLIILIAFAFLQTGSALPIALRLVALVIAITVHECSHAWAANRLGDSTAASLGRVTLNPLKHLDPMGSMMMLVTTITGLGIGWGKPVPVASYRLRYGPRLGNGLVSVAGPAANIVAAVIFAAAGRLIGLWAGAPSILLQVTDFVVLVNLVIAFFNLLPVPPLDGFAVLVALLSLIGASWGRNLVGTLESLSRYGWMILLAVIMVSQFTGMGLLNRLVGGPAYALFGLLTGI